MKTIFENPPAIIAAAPDGSIQQLTAKITVSPFFYSVSALIHAVQFAVMIDS